MASAGALSDIKVVELGQLLAGPFCGQLLGGMGADVIKVEPPGEGDPMRLWGQGAEKVQWEVIARNKRSVSANLRIPEGQALVRSLIAKADVLIENFKPLQLAGMICDLECQLQKANERKKLWQLIAHAFQDDNFKPVFEHLQTMTFEDSK